MRPFSLSNPTWGSTVVREHLPEELIERFYIDGVCLPSEHLDEQKVSWEHTHLRRTKCRGKMALALHEPQSEEAKT